MADRYTLDASVAAKWFNNENLTDKALQVRDAFVEGKIGLLAPEHLLYEIGNSIWKNKALAPEDAVTAIKSLADLEIELIHLSQEMSGNTMRIARELSITFYDAAYVMLANHFDALLISADQMVLSKSKKSIHLKDFKL